MKQPFDMEAFLNQTIFGMDALAMLGDIEDFIEFSERNIDWQKQHELKRAEDEHSESRFENPQDAAQYHDQMIDGVTFRFEVSLTQRLRYAALTSLITTIEWILISLKKRAAFDISKKPDKKSEAVHLLEEFSLATELGLTSEIQVIESLVQVRNCIVHAAGLLDSFRFGPHLRKRLEGFQGIKISNINFLGDGIEVESGHLQSVLEDVKRWLPILERALHEKGLLRK
jgi:uncharacterized protein YutE (UPF0331/DUF86 family)